MRITSEGGSLNIGHAHISTTTTPGTTRDPITPLPGEFHSSERKDGLRFGDFYFERITTDGTTIHPPVE